MGNLPTFLIIGAPKCATTRMHELLDTHPQVCMSRIKETHFFSFQRLWRRGWDWYRSLFTPNSETLAMGEASPEYCLVDSYPHVMGRIIQNLPEVKLILMVRHPIRRIESEWLMGRETGRLWGMSLDEALGKSDCIEASSYWRIVSRYLQVFPPERICVIFLEDLKADQERELRRCFEHIGVVPDLPREQAPSTRMRSRDNRREDRALTRRFRKWLVFKVARDAAPKGLRSFARRLLTQPQGSSVVWDQALYHEVVQRLRPDAEQFLQWCGKPQTFWHWPESVDELNQQVTVADARSESGWWSHG